LTLVVSYGIPWCISH